MSMTSDQLVDWARSLIQEAVALAYSDANIRAFLNLAIDELWPVVYKAARDKGWLVERATAVELTADDDTYSYPTGYVNITAIKVKNSTGKWQTLHKLDAEELVEDLDSIDPPTHYTLLKDEFVLSPPPLVTRSGGLRIYGEKEPTHFDGTTDETSGLPRQCDRLLAMRAAHLMLDAEGSPMAPAFERMYERGLLGLPSDLDARHPEAFDPEVDTAPRQRYPGGEPIDV